ncbi:hypothetical protein VaNZ11_012330 [Volvox africanus]|uniref:BACK domain-containing protein n=1 Tax=Volvox africanus TaxID=51714 RepID=A0ABQ5SDK5_9CHLO|nr:hypothetical protein VaNZ11_012330 [Volvox africanus]
MTGSVNKHVARAISSLFASGRDADMLIIFCQETGLNERAGKDDSRRLVLSDPLPAHQLVLRYASERFAVEFERWGKQRPDSLGTQVVPGDVSSIDYDWLTSPRSDALPADDTLASPDSTHVPQRQSLQPAQITAADPGSESPAGPDLLQSPATAHKGLPISFVPLGSADEVPSARAAIHFAYTGRITAGSIREVLELRRQGAYLQITGCTAACDEAIISMLNSGCTPRNNNGCDGGNGSYSSSLSNQGCNGQQSATSDDTGGCGLPAGVDLYINYSLWPDLDADLGFSSVLSAAKPQLVAHFGDALKALNTSLLREQLLVLPAVALEALLESDEFGTDTESTVLLLLAVWMEANFILTNSDMRQRLCRTIRLAHLSRPYLSLVLPALAADHEKDPGSLPGWFPFDVMQAAFVANLAGLPESERMELLFLSSLPAYVFEALSLPRRRLCSTASGLTFSWHAAEQELLQKNAHAAQPGCISSVPCIFSEDITRCAAHGFEWRLCVPQVAEDMNTAISLFCELPAALAFPGSRLSKPCGLWTHVPVVATIKVQAGTGQGGVQIKKGGRSDMLWVGMRWDVVLPSLAQRQTQHQQQLRQRPQLRGLLRHRHRQQQQAVDQSVAEDRHLLAAWTGYMLSGKVSGTLTLQGIP